VKQICNKILKRLREELAGAQTVYVKRLNTDIIEFESTQRTSTEKMRQMSTDELIKLVQSLKQDILSLRITEVFLKKCSE